jgi:hypothetical protein
VRREVRVVILRAVAVAVVVLAGCDSDRRRGPEPAPGAEPGTAKGAPAKIFEIAATPDPGCRRGEWCTVRMELTALGGFHVNRDYPFKFVGAAAEGIEHDGTGAFTIESDTTGVLVHRFRAAAAGAARVSGTFKLSVCTEEQCEIEAAPVAVEVPVS